MRQNWLENYQPVFFYYQLPFIPLSQAAYPQRMTCDHRVLQMISQGQMSSPHGVTLRERNLHKLTET
jgi:hypothetical protein